MASLTSLKSQIWRLFRAPGNVFVTFPAALSCRALPTNWHAAGHYQIDSAGEWCASTALRIFAEASCTGMSPMEVHLAVCGSEVREIQ